MSNKTEMQEQESEQPNEEAVTPQDIAEQVAAIHGQIDQFKSWSKTISKWLEDERKRLREEGNISGAAETLQLIQHVESVFLRIELGDQQTRPSTTKQDDSDADGGDDGEI